MSLRRIGGAAAILAVAIGLGAALCLGAAILIVSNR